MRRPPPTMSRRWLLALAVALLLLVRIGASHAQEAPSSEPDPVADAPSNEPDVPPEGSADAAPPTADPPEATPSTPDPATPEPQTLPLRATLLQTAAAAQATAVSRSDVARSVAVARAPTVALPSSPVELATLIGLNVAALESTDRLATELAAARARVEQLAVEVTEARLAALLLDRRRHARLAADPPAPSPVSATADATSPEGSPPSSDDPDALGDDPLPSDDDARPTEPEPLDPEPTGGPDTGTGTASPAEGSGETPVDRDLAPVPTEDARPDEDPAPPSPADDAKAEVNEAWRAVRTAEDGLRESHRRVAALEQLSASVLQMQAEVAERFLDTSHITEEITQERQRLSAETERTSRLEEDALRARAEATRAREQANTELERAAASEAERFSDELSAIASERRREESEQSEVTDAKEAFLVQRSEFNERLRALQREEADLAEREDLAWRFFQNVRTLRQQDRAEALEARERLRIWREQLEDLRAELRTAESALQLLEASDDPTLTDQLRSALRSARRGAVAVAEARLELEQWRIDLHQRRWMLARQKVFYYATLSDQLMPLLSRQRRNEVVRFTSANLREERLNLRDRIVGLQVITQDRLERTGEFVEALLTFEGIARIFRVMGASLFAILLLIGITRYRMPLLARSLEAVQRFRWARRRQRIILKAAELLRDLVRPVALYFAIALVRRQFGADVPELELLKSLIQTLVLYVIVMTAARTLLLPRSVRGFDGTDATRLDTFGIDVVPITGETARLVVLTLRVWLVYTIGTSFTSGLVHFVLGEGLASYTLDRLFFFGQVLLVYAILWWWRAVIIDNTLALTRQTETELGQRLRGQQERPWVVVLLAFLALYVLAVRTWAWLRAHASDLSLVRRARNFIFRKKVERSQHEKNRSGAASVDAREVPPEYRDAFDGSIPVDDSLYVPRLAQRTRIVDLFEQWRAGGPSGTVVTAEWGMGKTVFLERVLASLDPAIQQDVVRLEHRVTTNEAVVALAAQALDLPDGSTEADVVRCLNDGPRRVLVIEDCERFFLRRIRGFDGLDTFLRIVSCTDRNVFWLLTFDAYAWQFVNRVRNRRHHFQLHVDLPPLTDEEARDLLQRRAALTRITADFSRLLDVDDSENDAAGSTTAIVQTEAGFYRLLNELAAGNPRVLLHYWLASVVPADADRVWVRLCERPAPSSLDKLSVPQLFALTALAQHQCLTAGEIAETIAVETEAVELDLSQLASKGLVRIEADGFARLSTHFFRAILTGLRVKNMLYHQREDA